MKNTQWIAVTGLDGSGKTGLVSRIVEWLESNNKKVYRDRLPHDQYLTKKLLNKSNDRYTDRMLFALDNRLFGTKLRKIKESENYDFVVTQRCFLDSFVHGAVQGFSYEWIEELNQISDLPRTDILIHLVADAPIAYERICDDPDADKFEYPEYIEKQELETRKAYVRVCQGKEPALHSFKKSKNIFVDTTRLTEEEVFQIVLEQLEHLLNPDSLEKEP